MKEYEFECTREMNGDRAYEEGDTRTMTALDAVDLVKSGALKPIGEEAEKAMADIFAKTPDDSYGIVHRPASMEPAKKKDAGDADRNKDAGDADRNKDAGDAGRNKTASAAPPASETPPAPPAAPPAAGTPAAPDTPPAPPPASGAATPPAAKPGGRRR